MLRVKGAQRRPHQPERAARVVPLVPQKQAKRPHRLLAQRGRVGPRVAPEQHRIQQVRLARARPQIAQPDKLPKLLYRFILW
jgi:hypothetical protein